MARPRAPGGPRPPSEGSPTAGAATVPSPPAERRENRAATARAARLSVLYVAGVVAVYAVLAAAAEAGPVGGAQGTTTDLLLAGLAAVVLGLAGVLVSLGAAPRSVELGEHETVVVGRFGHRYRFPGRAELTTTVLRRLPASLLSPVALETVEISGGTSRRTFLLEEGLLQGGPRTGGAPV